MLPELTPAVDYVRSQTGETCFDYAVILGSGLGAVAEAAAPASELAYRDIPGFACCDVPGHAGKLLWGNLEGKKWLFFQGRFHLYQGLSVSQVVAPVVLAHRLGCNDILITNASGAINPLFSPGEAVFVSDHINLSGVNPLTGLSPPPFIDLSDLYRRSRYPDMRAFCAESGSVLHQGVLASLPGPSYETPAEIRMLKAAGADLVSMSTVNEAIAAHFLGMRVTALAIVANPAAGLAESSLDHQEVLAVSQRAVSVIRSLLEYLMRNP